jgi:hypothetical protein
MIAWRWSMRLQHVAMTACVLVLSACTSDLPTYPWMSDRAALEVVSTRLESVHTVSASADVVLTSSRGGTVSMDGAFASKPPTKARLRAWKFGNPVLDITVLPEGTWMFLSERDGSDSAASGKMAAQGVARALELLSGTYFAKARVLHDESTRSRMVLVGPALGQEDVWCEVDRTTLTPRVFRMAVADPAGAGRTVELHLDGYKAVGGVAWSTRMRFISPEGDILLRLGDVELNGDLAVQALVPPARANKLP